MRRPSGLGLGLATLIVIFSISSIFSGFPPSIGTRHVSRTSEPRILKTISERLSGAQIDQDNQTPFFRSARSAGRTSEGHRIISRTSPPPVGTSTKVLELVDSSSACVVRYRPSGDGYAWLIGHCLRSNSFSPPVARSTWI